MLAAFIKMLSSWKQPCLSFSQQYVLAQRVSITVHHKFSTRNIAEKVDRSPTFKERSFDFFQKSEKYKDMWVPSNKMFHIPGYCETDGQSKRTMTDLIIDFSVSETVSNALKKPACYSSLISGPSQEKNVSLVLDHCTVPAMQSKSLDKELLISSRTSHLGFPVFLGEVTAIKRLFAMHLRTFQNGRLTLPVPQCIRNEYSLQCLVYE